MRGEQGREGGGVAAPAAQEHVVAAAQQRLGRIEQVGDRGLEQHVAVVEQHLAVAAQAEGFEGEELPQSGREVRARGAQGGQPAAQCGGDGLEAQAGAHLREMAAVWLGQPVVDDDEVAVEAGVVLQKGAEGGERTRYEAFRGRRDEAGLP